MAKTKHPSSKFLLRGTSLHKTKHSAPKNAKKKMQKAVRKAQVNGLEETEVLLKKNSLSARVPKVAKAAPAKKHKVRNKSHNTTPGETPTTSTPQGIHPEGRRWAKTLKTQEASHAKDLARRYQKKQTAKRQLPKKLLKK